MTPTLPRGYGQDPPLDRRQFLATCGVLAGAGVAGCSAIVDFIANWALSDVNVMNAAEQPVRGSVDVTGPGGELLDEEFDLKAGDDDDGSATSYDNVLADGGTYEVAITLTEGEISGRTAATESVMVSNPDDEHVVVLLGADGAEDSITVTVIETFSDLEPYLEE